MSTFAQNHVQQVFVGGTASSTAAGLTLAGANTGEICILNPEGTIMSESDAGSATSFRVGLNRGTEPNVISDTIGVTKVSNYKLKAYAAATQQLDYIGYNGTAGSIEVNNNALYYVRLYLEDLFNRSSSDGRRVKFGAYKSTAAATQEAIAFGITDSLIRNFQREAEDQIKFERICDEAGVALGTGVGALTFTKGSKFVTAATAIENDSGAGTALVVGDYLRAGTAVTSPIYKITAIDTTAGGFVTLDIPYQGDDLTGADTAFEQVEAAAAAAAEWGLKLTGLPLDYKLGKIKYKVSRFETQVDSSEGFISTPITKAAAASPGTGTLEIVQELEWFTQGHEGEFFRMGEPHIFDARKDAVAPAGGGYTMLDIMFVDDQVLGLGSLVSSSKHVTLCIPTTTPGYAVTGSGDDITDVLEVLLAGSVDGSLALS